MDRSRDRRGSVPKKLGASSFLLELTPDPQAGEAPSWQRSPAENFSNYQLTQTRVEEGRRDPPYTGSQSLQWSREDRVPPGVKCRLTRSKRRPGLDPDSVSKEHVIFTDSPVSPGIPVVYRPPEERAVNPDRLNLDRRHLSVCPILEGEDRLRLLNLQHNCISRLQHLSSLRRLVFLDLYDNLVQEMTGLEGLVSLRVLMLGKNRIHRIAGLQALVKLDVLDLHGNTIRDIEHLSHLTHLRVLNLAGNEISCVAQLSGLQALTELNLRRNRITAIFEVDQLPNLQRLFLSHNLIQSFEDMACLSQCVALSELTLDGNPLANATDYRPSVVFHIRHLCILDQCTITEEERSEALAVVREEEERERELHRLAQIQEHKEAAIAAIRKVWEASHRHLGALVSSAVTHSSIAVGRGQTKQSLRSSSMPHLLPSYFVDLSGSSLHLYGGGALEVLESPPHGSQDVGELYFHCMEFDDIVPWLHRIPLVFPSLFYLSFECTNISSLGQLNALPDLSCSVQHLVISSWGNPVTLHCLFRSYALYRLHHLGLEELNRTVVTEQELATAEQLFGSLSSSCTSRLPCSRLVALASRRRPRSVGSKCSSLLSNESQKRSGMCQDPLDKVALFYSTAHSHQPDAACEVRATVSRSFCARLLSSVLDTHCKQQVLAEAWPRLMASLVQNTLQEYCDLDARMKALLDSL